MRGRVHGQLPIERLNARESRAVGKVTVKASESSGLGTNLSLCLWMGGFDLMGTIVTQHLGHKHHRRRRIAAHSCGRSPCRRPAQMFLSSCGWSEAFLSAQVHHTVHRPFLNVPLWHRVSLPFVGGNAPFTPAPSATGASLCLIIPAAGTHVEEASALKTAGTAKEAVSSRERDFPPHLV